MSWPWCGTANSRPRWASSSERTSPSGKEGRSPSRTALALVGLAGRGCAGCFLPGRWGAAEDCVDQVADAAGVEGLTGHEPLVEDRAEQGLDGQFGVGPGGELAVGHALQDQACQGLAALR